MDQGITITVISPEQRSEIGGVNKFFVYTIKGHDNKGQLQILRRYSDFNLLRQILVKRWPGCYVPSLPQKKTIGSNEHLFVESRRRGLQLFLLGVSLLEPMWYSEQMQLFLRNNTGDSEKLLSPLMKQSHEKIFIRYKQTFPDFNRQANTQSVLKINEFQSYIKDSKVFLDKLTEQTQKMNDLYKQNMERKLTLIEFMLPDYEKNCLLQNDEKKKQQNLLFIVEDFQIPYAVKDYKQAGEYPSVMYVSEQIKRERKQLQAFEELIKVKHEYDSLKLKAINKVKDLEVRESKINAGKETIISKIKKQTKQEQLAQNKGQLEHAKDQQAMYTVLSTMITNLLADREIDRFKQLRQKAYFKMLKGFAESEKAISMAEHQIWARASEHDCIWEEGFEESLGMKGTEIKHVKHPKGKYSNEKEEEQRKEVMEVIEKREKQVKNEENKEQEEPAKKQTEEK